MKKKQIALFAWIGLLVLIAISWTLINNWATTPPTPAPTPQQVDKVTRLWDQILDHAAAPPMGNVNARYTLVEFGDFQCPNCGHIEPKVYQFVTGNQDRMSFYFVQLPLDKHPQARLAAEAAQTAAAHGKFWPMYRVLYANQAHLEPGYLPGYASQAGVDPHAFRAEMDIEEYMPQVLAARDFSDSIGIPATPTFLLRDNQKNKVAMFVGNDMLKLMKHPPWTPPSAKSGPAQKPVAG